MRKTTLAWAFCTIFASATTTSAAPLGATFTYQGALKQSGGPVTASADMQFKLFDAATGGAQVASTLTFDGAGGNPAPVGVNGGVFTVGLNFGVASFDGDSRWLEISVRVPAGVGAYTTLTPRQPLTGAPYALQTRGLFTDANLNVGIGTTTPTAKLNISSGDLVIDRGTAVSTVTRSLTLGGARDLNTADFALIDFRNYDIADSAADYVGARIASRNDGSDDGDLRFSVAADGVLSQRVMINSLGNVGIGSSNPLSPLSFPNSVGEKIRLWGTAANHFGMGVQGGLLQLHSDAQSADIAFGWGSSDAFNEKMRVKGNGNVGIGTSAPTTKLEVAGSAKVTTLEVTDEIVLPNGTLRRGGAAPASTDLGLYSLTAGSWLRLVTNSAPIQFFTNSTQGSAAAPAADSAALTIAANGNVGIGTHSPVAKLDVNGVARVNTLEIDAGADVAENFDVAPSMTHATAPQHGMVVSIDPREIGKLIVADQPYDHRVAGIISGAGGIKPGLVLAQPGTVADGELPVASMGRVWCWADAGAGGSIEAGDLLTTSSTPGHAMRAEHDRAGGSVIGKAMSSLSSGRGLVLVLVSLQ